MINKHIFSKDSFKKDILLNYLFYFLLTFFSFYNVKLFAVYLGNSMYGLWLTLSSVVSWMNIGDFGIGNGLRNKIAELYGSDEKKHIFPFLKKSVSFLAKLSFVSFPAFYLLCKVLMHFNILDTSLNKPMLIMLIFSAINMIIGLSRSVAYGCQKSWMTSMATFFHQFFLFWFVVILILLKNSPDLSILAIANGICLTLANAILIICLNHVLSNHRIMKDSFGENEHKTLDSAKINKTGIGFFFLQICSIILFSTDNLIINYFFTSDNVTKYSNISKIYDTGNSIYSVMMISLWSAVTYHYYSNDIKWIFNTIKKLLFVFAIYSFGVVFVSIFINPIMGIWMEENAFYYNSDLIILFAIYSILTAFSSIFINVLNGLGLIKLQLALGVGQAVINIPLSVVLSVNYHMGIYGVKLATFLCLLPAIIILPIQMIIYLKKFGNDYEDD